MSAVRDTNRFAKDRLYTSIGNAIRFVREEREVTATELARQAGITLRTIQKAEDGVHCSVYVLARIADVLDCTVDELIPLEATK